MAMRRGERERRAHASHREHLARAGQASSAVVEPALAAAPVRALESGGESQVVLKRRPAKALVTTNHAGFL